MQGAPLSSFPSQVNPRRARGEKETKMGHRKNDPDLFRDMAKGYFEDYFETGSMEYIHKGNLVSMIAIADTLVEIRDELRKINEREDRNNGTT